MWVEDPLGTMAHIGDVAKENYVPVSELRHPTKQGWMVKRGTASSSSRPHGYGALLMCVYVSAGGQGTFKNWKKRYFVLSGAC